MPALPTIELPLLRGGPGLRWGIIGPGFIAGEFASALIRGTDQPIVAVASRSLERAERFASRYGIPAAYDRVAHLAEDARVDIVYIAGPHSAHASLAIDCIAAGKHVLVEKPLALTAASARDVREAARANGVLAMEALWTRYLPRTALLEKILEEGMLGELQVVTADTGAVFDSSPAHRSQDPVLGGGALLDLGVYALWLARFVLGPLRLEAVSGGLSPTGVDDQSSLILSSSSQALAALTVTMRVATANRAAIAGTAGRVEIHPPFFIPGGLAVRIGSETTEWRDPSGLEGNLGLAWQTVAAARLVDAGVLDSPGHPLAAVVDNLAVIDEARRHLGAARYPGEVGER